MGWLGALPTQAHARVYAHIVAITLGFALITYFHVVVGELVPKSLALRRAEALAVAVAPPMLVFMAMVRPAVRLLKVSAAVDPARIRYSHHRARRRSLARGAQADRHRRAPHGPAAQVPGDPDPPRPRTG